MLRLDDEGSPVSALTHQFYWLCVRSDDAALSEDSLSGSPSGEADARTFGRSPARCYSGSEPMALRGVCQRYWSRHGSCHSPRISTASRPSWPGSSSSRCKNAAPAGDGSRSIGVTRSSSRGMGGSVATPIARPPAIRIAAGGNSDTPKPSATRSTRSGRASTSQTTRRRRPTV